MLSLVRPVDEQGTNAFFPTTLLFCEIKNKIYENLLDLFRLAVATPPNRHSISWLFLLLIYNTTVNPE